MLPRWYPWSLGPNRPGNQAPNQVWGVRTFLGVQLERLAWYLGITGPLMSGSLRYEVWEVSSLLSLGSTNTRCSHSHALHTRSSADWYLLADRVSKKSSKNALKLQQDTEKQKELTRKAASFAVEIRCANFYGVGRTRICLVRKRYIIKRAHVIDHMSFVRLLLRMWETGIVWHGWGGRILT